MSVGELSCAFSIGWMRAYVSMTHCWAVEVFLFCTKMQAGRYVGEECLFSLMDDGMACQYTQVIVKAAKIIVS